ncbi:hypothetical protein HUT11_35250 (plasmid) [Streptomyces seoulensis]|nr:hypothetical protein HUT11_35250 [Streptomyces seoulensis]
MRPATLLLLPWLLGWLTVSAVAVYIVKNAPGDDGWLWDLEDQLPLVVVLLLLAWPVLLAQILWKLAPVGWRVIRGN